MNLSTKKKQIPACTLVKYMDPATLLGKFPSADIAGQMTLCDWEVFSSIEPTELLNQAWNKDKYKYR